MKIKVEPLTRGVCPICNKKIMDEKKSSYINGGQNFFVKFHDGTIAEFAICKDCFFVLTQEQIDKIVESQKVNWGMEIQFQLQWYINEAIHLKAVKWAEKREGL